MQIDEEIKKEFEQKFCFKSEDGLDILCFYQDNIPEEIINFWLSKFHTLQEEYKKELIENHYCCKYKTIKKEDFCDECLKLLGNIIKQ